MQKAKKLQVESESAAFRKKLNTRPVLEAWLQDINHGCGRTSLHDGPSVWRRSFAIFVIAWGAWKFNKFPSSQKICRSKFIVSWNRCEEGVSSCREFDAAGLPH